MKSFISIIIINIKINIQRIKQDIIIHNIIKFNFNKNYHPLDKFKIFLQQN